MNCSLYFSTNSYLASAFTNTQRVRLLNRCEKAPHVEVTPTIMTMREKPKVH
jgi:hypothetical protein